MNDWEKIYSHFVDALEALPHYKALYNHMIRMEKTVYGGLYTEAEGKTVGDREAVARSRLKYIEFLDQLHDVEERKLKLEATIERGRTRLDLYRTDESTRREEMRLAR